MKRSQWQLWGVLSLVSLALGIRAFTQIPAASAGGSGTAARLITAAWCVSLIRALVRMFRGLANDRHHQQRDDRMTPGRDLEGNSTLVFGIDLLGQRVDLFLLFLTTATFALGFSLDHDAAGSPLAWIFGAFSWLMLVTLVRALRFAPHFSISDRGIECRSALPSLIASWDEIAVVRSTSAPGTTGWVLLTVTDAALSRFDEKTRGRMERLFKRKNAHYRWPDHHSYSSAHEVASIVEDARAHSSVRALAESEQIPPSASAFSVSPSSPGSPTWRQLMSDPGSLEGKLELEHEAARRRATTWALVGAGLRIVSFFLPWVAAHGVRTIYLDGSKAGAPLLSIWFSLAAAGLALAFAYRRQIGPGLLLGLGIGAVIASLVNVLVLMDTIHQARILLIGRGIELAPSVGPWVQLIGAAGILVGGALAVRLNERQHEHIHTVPAPPTGTMPFPGARSTPRTADPVSRRPSMPPPPPAPTTSRAKSTTKIVIALIGALALVFFVVPTFLGARTRAQQLEASRQASASASPSQPTPSITHPAVPASEPPPKLPHGEGAPSYQVDATHAGDARNAHVHMPLSVAWARTLGGDVGNPLIADGELFVGVVFRDGRGKEVLAFDAKTGHTLWTRDESGTGDIPMLTYDVGHLFVLNRDGVLDAYGAGSGALSWTAKLADPEFTSPPTAWGGRLFVGGSGHLYAIDETLGTTLWTQSVSSSPQSAPTLFGPNVTVANACSQIQTFDAGTGSIRWNDDEGCPGGGAATTAYYDGRIYAHEDGLPAGTIVNASDGSNIGTFTSSTIPAFGGDDGYFIENETLQARDLSTLAPLWSFTGGGSLGSAPLVVGNLIFVASVYGTLYVLGQGGRLVASFGIGATRVAPDEKALRPLPSLNAGDGVVAVTVTNRVVVLH